MREPTKNAACARPTLYSSPQTRPHSETVETAPPPTHSQALGSMEQRDDDGVHDSDIPENPLTKLSKAVEHTCMVKNQE